MSTEPRHDNKKKAGITVVAVVIAIALVIFVGLNMRNVDEADEPPPANSQTPENAAPS